MLRASVPLDLLTAKGCVLPWRCALLHVTRFLDTFRGSLVIVFAESALRGLNGFVPGSRGSLMLDVVFVAMFVIVPLLAISIYLVKYQRRYALHKRLQLGMAGVLLVAVTLFELDMQFFTKWEDRAVGSPYFDPANKWGCPAGLSLIVHLSCAVPTLVLWIAVVVLALRKFSRPPLPGAHSRWHARWGFLAAAGMTMTAITGWLFYWLAFVAEEPASAAFSLAKFTDFA